MKSTVPFTIQNVFQGFAETEGILSVEGANLKLEFQTADNVLENIQETESRALRRGTPDRSRDCRPPHFHPRAAHQGHELVR
jgi:hypothetical protein